MFVAEECPPGFFNMEDGLSPCSIVPAGKFWVDPMTIQSCPEGTNSTQDGAKSQTACTGNHLTLLLLFQLNIWLQG